MISSILVILTLLMCYITYIQLTVPLPPLNWSRLSDFMFASGFVLLNSLNMGNLILFKLRTPIPHI